MSQPQLLQLFDQLYGELKLRAHAVRRHSGLITLETTGLVHETVIKLIEAHAQVNDRTHLLNLAARVMRQVLLNSIEAAAVQKRGGSWQRVELDDQLPGQTDVETTLQVFQAIDRLQHEDKRLAAVFTLRTFAGFGFVEIGQMLAVSHTTVQRDYERARAFLLSVYQDFTEYDPEQKQ